jgi:hypothetical protein
MLTVLIERQVVGVVLINSDKISKYWVIINFCDVPGSRFDFHSFIILIFRLLGLKLETPTLASIK